MQIETHLTFNGCCREAFAFYEQVLGGKIEMTMTYGESPMAAKTPAEWRDKVLHTRLLAGSAALMGADAPQGQFQKVQGCYVTLFADSTADAERLFQGLAEKGTVQMPMGETFWAERFGMLVDRFGTPWMVSSPGASAKV